MDRVSTHFAGLSLRANVHAHANRRSQRHLAVVTWGNAASIMISHLWEGPRAGGAAANASCLVDQARPATLSLAMLDWEGNSCRI